MELVENHDLCQQLDVGLEIDLECFVGLPVCSEYFAHGHNVFSSLRVKNK